MNTSSTASPTRSRPPSSPEEQHRPMPLALDDSATKPVLRRGPGSPVMVSFGKEGAYQAFNADFETARPDSERSLDVRQQEQEQKQGQQLQQQQPQQRIQQQAQQSRDMPQPLTVVVHPTNDDPQSEKASRETRQSGESDLRLNKEISADSSEATSASSISGTVENSDGGEGYEVCEPVPTFQYHHHQQDFPPRSSSSSTSQLADPRSASQPNLLDPAANGRLMPNPHTNPNQRTSLVRPHSTASLQSELLGGPGRRSPNNRMSTIGARRSPDARPTSYAELLTTPYPQNAPAPLMLDNSGLRNAVGENASLLSTQKTLEMYRANVKKTTDAEVQYSFAVFLISTAQEQGIDFDAPKPSGSSRRGNSGDESSNGGGDNSSGSSSLELIKEARNILQKLASNGYPFAQYYLADGYASGLFNKGKEDYGQAFPLFVLAAKHGHAESAYRTALCYEFGAGCRKDPARAVQFLRSAASKRHPGAMTRLAQACLFGDLGEKRYREGVKWMRLAAEAADVMYNQAPYQLGCMYETGYGDDIFEDQAYAAELFTQAAELGNPEASYRMGDAYENGKLSCPKDPALSIHFYTGAAERGHAGAMMGLCAWYMVGAPGILEEDREEAFEWARKAADLGLVKAQFTVGYFTEMGIGCQRDALEANLWYVRAADAGSDRAKQRLAIIRAAATGIAVPKETGAVAAQSSNKLKKADRSGDKSGDDGQCVVM